LWHRRNLFALGGAALLGGCGFRPLYGPDGDRAGTDAPREPALVREMAAVRVTRIPERNGQLLRRNLQRQFEAMGPGTAGRYELQASFTAQVEPAGLRRDGTASRVRYLVSAPWILTDIGAPPTVLARGTARTLDAYNLPDLQFFAAEASRDDLERRVVEELSDRIVIGVAAALRQRLRA